MGSFDVLEEKVKGLVGALSRRDKDRAEIFGIDEL
jgi:hypothetical protein